MNRACRDHELAILAAGGDPAAFEEALRAHVALCPACADMARRAARAAELFRTLSRHSTPAELDGRVVAALHAGFREERVSAAVRSLRRTSVPIELERKLLEAQSSSATAPPVLDRRLSEDLRDPSQAIARRFASRLERLPAPDSLFARVERAARACQRQVRRPSFSVVGALAAAVLLCVGATILLSRMRGDSAPQYRFDVEYATSLEALDPIARDLLASLSGGVTDASLDSSAVPSPVPPLPQERSEGPR